MPNDPNAPSPSLPPPATYLIEATRAWPQADQILQRMAGTPEGQASWQQWVRDPDPAVRGTVAVAAMTPTAWLYILAQADPDCSIRIRAADNLARRQAPPAPQYRCRQGPTTWEFGTIGPNQELSPEG